MAESKIAFLGSRLVLPYQNGQKHGVLYVRPSELGAIVEEGSAVGVIVGGELRWLKGGITAGDLVSVIDAETAVGLIMPEPTYATATEVSEGELKSDPEPQAQPPTSSKKAGK